jgi:hypothetical protein
MAGESLRVRFQRGDVVLELDGDAAVVQALLSGYRKNGYGRIAEFFGWQAVPATPTPTTITPTTTVPLTPLTTVARTLRFAADHITLPMSRQDFAFDLTGDGRPDNQFGNIVGAFMAQNLDLQPAVTEGVRSGATLLFDLDLNDAALGVDQRADLTVRIGAADPNGAGYTVDPTVAPAKLPGFLTAGRFATPTPTAGVEPPVVLLPLSLFSPAGLRLPIRAFRIDFALPPSGTTLTDGHIHGAIADSDVDRTVAPALARMLTAQIAADPTSTEARQIAALFDLGGCRNADGSQAQPGDGVIDVCEVLTNPLLKNVLNPDIQLYDATGRFAPGLGPTKDSLSIGVGFTAVAQT